MRIDHVRPAAERLAEGLLGLVHPVLALQRPRQHDPGFRRVEALGEGAAASGLRLGVSRHIALGRRQIVLGDAAGGRPRDRLGIDGDRLSQPALRLQCIAAIG